MISLFLPSRAATVQTLGHPAAGVIGWFDSSSNASGVAVTKESALTFAAVWCATRVIAETLGTLPCVLYRRLGDDSRERATDDSRYTLMHDEPHPQMSACSFFETQTAHMVLEGNCYAKIVEGTDPNSARLEPRMPSTVTPNVEGDRITYSVEGTDLRETINAADMLHVAGLGPDGINGWSVVKYAAQSIGTGMAGEQYAASMMGTGATPNGIIEHPGRLDKEAREHLRREWNESHKGSKKAGNIGIMHGGMKFQAVSMSAEDAQFLESREYSVREIARWFRLPPHMLADLADSSVRANIEQQAIEFVVYSLTPWLTRWQQALNRKLLDKEERKELYFEFLLESLLRGDSQARFNSYAMGRQWGWLSINDIRRLENMNAIEDGNDYLEPINMRVVGEEPREPVAREQLPERAVADLRQNLAQSLAAIQCGYRDMRADIRSGQLALCDLIHDADERTDGRIAELREDREGLRQSLHEVTAQVQGWTDEQETLADACRDLLREHLGCLLKVERSKVTGAAKLVARGYNFVGWADDYYAAMQAEMAGRITDVCRTWERLRPAFTDTAKQIAANVCLKHKAALLVACDGDREGFVGRVQATIDAWEPMTFEDLK